MLFKCEQSVSEWLLDSQRRELVNVSVYTHYSCLKQQEYPVFHEKWWSKNRKFKNKVESISLIFVVHNAIYITLFVLVWSSLIKCAQLNRRLHLPWMHINYMLSTTSENIQAAASSFSTDRSNIYGPARWPGSTWAMTLSETHVPSCHKQTHPFFRKRHLSRVDVCMRSEMRS